MDILTVSANVSCSRLMDSVAWYTSLFGREPTRFPMAGLAEWAIAEQAEVQLFETAVHAGHSTLTIAVASLEQEHARLSSAGLVSNEIEQADRFAILRLHDPDGNLVVLVGKTDP